MSNIQNINWYPGHMVKSLTAINESVKLVDIIIELVDARAPLSSRNPVLTDIAVNKPRIILLTKKDLANENLTVKWRQFFIKQGYYAYACNLHSFAINQLVNVMKEALKDKMEKERARGIRPRPIRAMIVGIPNVGKSTLVNRLATKKVAMVGNKPGVTRSKQWIRYNEDFELLDTPGVLWPNIEDKKVAVNLALIGTIKEEILPNDYLIHQLFLFLSKLKEKVLNKRYGIDESKIDYENIEPVLNEIGRIRGFLLKDGLVDIDKTVKMILKEFKDGILGSFTLEEIENG